MSVYNELPYLEGAVRSVLNQTYEDFEFIIVNDGSTDGSKRALEQYANSDDRIQLVHQKNRGLPASLNRGLEMARGRYIARMDADDISHPERFGRQVRFLDANPKIGILGTKIEKIDSRGRIRWKWSLPSHPDVIAWQLLFNTCLCHPTIMARRSVMEDLGGYAEWAKVGQDYELWTRAVLQTRLANLPKKLYKLRRHQKTATVSRRENQIQVCIKAAVRLHERILGESADCDISEFLVWMEVDGIGKAVDETNTTNFSRVHSYIRSLYRAYARQLCQEKSNIRTLRRALRKLDTAANEVLKTGKWGAGIVCKLQSWSIVSTGEIFPLVWAVLRSRIDRNLRFPLG